jgi:hypothetical protein
MLRPHDAVAAVAASAAAIARYPRLFERDIDPVGMVRIARLLDRMAYQDGGLEPAGTTGQNRT